MKEMKEICEACRGQIPYQLRSGEKVSDMVYRNIKELEGECQYRQCQRLCVPLIETELWFQSLNERN